MLRVDNLWAGYGEKPVIENISFDLNAGRSLCILGPNGCGKTTLLRAMASLIEFEGSVTIAGKNVRDMKRRDLAGAIAVMSQLTSVFLPYSVYETVMLGRFWQIRRSLFGTATEKDREMVEECMQAVGIEDIRDRTIDTLSGGQLQRVLLAKALVQEPKLILLDEPTNHLDMKCQIELIEYLKQWSASKEHAVIGVFHDINLALKLSDDMMFMKDGKIAGQGQFEEIATRAFLKDIYEVDVVEYMMESLGRWKGQ